MSESSEALTAAHSIADAGRYLTLATADAEGRPWATPVWYAHDDYREFLWVSRPDARHSQNLAVRPEAGIVIFDSTVPVGEAQALYVEAVAEELGGADRDHALAVFSRASESQGVRAWTQTDVEAPAPHRLYRAAARRQFILGANDARLEVGSADEPARTLAPPLELLRASDRRALGERLAGDVEFRSPVADYSGPADVAHLLTLIGGIVEDVRSAREVTAGDARIAFFNARVGERRLEGVLTARTGGQGLIAEITLMLRPLRALQAAVTAMAASLESDPLPSSRGD